jgi:hypothetical protein
VSLYDPLSYRFSVDNGPDDDRLRAVAIMTLKKFWPSSSVEPHDDDNEQKIDEIERWQRSATFIARRDRDFICVVYPIWKRRYWAVAQVSTDQKVRDPLDTENVNVESFCLFDTEAIKLAYDLIRDPY